MFALFFYPSRGLIASGAGGHQSRRADDVDFGAVTRLHGRVESRSLGRSGLLVSRIGMGLAALGRPGYINIGHADDLGRQYEAAAMQARTHAVLDAAWAAGLRYFDAARSYGRAEEFLARWVAARRVAPEAVVVGSKWGYTYTADWQVNAAQHEVKEHSATVLRRQIGESRALLTDHLDLYQIHSATLDSGVLDNQPVLEELARLRAGGLAIGLTLSGLQQAATLDKAMHVTVANAPLFDVVQATWNLLEPSAGPALQAAHTAGIGVIIKEALANGRLTARNRDGAFAAHSGLLAEIAAERSTTVDALALAAVLAQPWADVVLTGPATVEQLRSNLAATAVQWDGGLAERLAVLVEPAQAYWSIRGRLAWT
jgi:aryl-alcohol dehydrogenase-like predicted oxidoreductase